MACAKAGEKNQPPELKMHEVGRHQRFDCRGRLGPIGRELVFEAGCLNSVLKVKGCH